MRGERRERNTVGSVPNPRPLRTLRCNCLPSVYCPPIHAAKSLEEAIRLAGRIARPGEVVLMSPACASFDMFRNYAERERSFREAVRAPVGTAEE